MIFYVSPFIFFLKKKVLEGTDKMPAGVTKIWNPKEGVLNSFAKPFTQYQNMPDIYANWSKSVENLHFHYLTTTPEQASKAYFE